MGERPGRSESSGNAGGPIEVGQRVVGAAPLDALDAGLDLAHGVEVFGQAGAIGRAEILLQPRQVGHH